MVLPLAATSGRLTRADHKLKLQKDFPRSFNEGLSLEQAGKTSILSLAAQYKLDCFIMGRGIYEAMQRDRDVMSRCNDAELLLAELYGELVRNARK